MKASMAHAAIYGPKFKDPQWSDVRYDSLAKEGHNSNVWAYACINAIATSASTVPILLYQTGGKNKKQIEQHPLLDLLKKPNDIQSGREFREEWAKYLLMAGKAFIEMNGPSDNNVTEMWNLRPDRMAIVPDARSLIAGYQLRGDGGIEIPIKREKVLYYRLFDPLNEFDGVSPLQVAARAVDQDNGANAYNKALLDNGGNPPGVITSESTLDDTVFKRLQSMIRQRFGGKKNAGRPLLLENGVKWQQTGLTPDDMQYTEMKKMNRIEICAAFNVPPEIIGDKEHATYSNYQEARSSFYEETVLPFLDFFLDKVNTHLAPKFGDNLELVIDRDSVDALSENTDSKWTRIISAVEKRVITPNEGREELGFSPREDGDKLLPPKPTGAGQDGAGDPPPDPKDTEGEKSNTRHSDDPFDRGIGLILGAVKQLHASKSEDDDLSFFLRFEEERTPFIASAHEMIQQRFKDELKAVLAATDEDGVYKALKSQEKEWEKLMAAIYYGAIEHFGNWNYERLKDEYDEKHGSGTFETKFFDRLFTMARRLIQKFIGETSVELVTYISETTREALRMVISDGVDKGLAWRDIGRNIEKVYGDDFDARRSMMIARTEIVAASNFGAREGAKATGLELEKQWVSTPDDRTRDTHVDCNGQTRDMDEYYKVGNSKGMFPGDPKLPAKERIHCRCAEKHKVKE